MSSSRRARYGCLFRALLLLAPLLLLIIGGEMFLHWRLGHSLAFAEDEADPVFRFDPEFGWAAIPGIDLTLETGERVRTNSTGFRDVEFIAPAPGKSGILFVGDSYTWGYQVEREQRFSNLVSERFADSYRTYNFGVTGYATDQQLLLVRKYAAACRPAVVILQYCNWNDDNDNLSSAQGLYGKPYYVRDEAGELEQRGLPIAEIEPLRADNVPWLSRISLASRWLNLQKRRPPAPPKDPLVTPALIKAVAKEAEAVGAEFLLVLVHDAPKLEAALGDDISILSMESVSRLPSGEWDLTNTFPDRGNHWTPKGNRLVADKISAELTRLFGE